MKKLSTYSILVFILLLCGLISSTSGAPNSHELEDNKIQNIQYNYNQESNQLTGYIVENGIVTKTEYLDKNSIHSETNMKEPLKTINPDQIILESFVSKWDTSLTSEGSSNSTQINLPLIMNGLYSFEINWGDGNQDVITTYNQSHVLHNYTISGVYQIVITGTLEGFNFNNLGDKLKLLEISQWGNISLGNGGGYFHGAENLVLTTQDSLNLTTTTSLARMFKDARSLGSSGNLNSWNTTGVTNMEDVFRGADLFNQPLNNWDTSKVTDMSGMFGAYTNSIDPSSMAFNQDLSTWDTSKVTDMNSMFARAKFNQPIGMWNTSSVTNLEDMFFGTDFFNQPLNNWDTSLVTDMSGTFGGTDEFNQPLSSWDVSSVTTMRFMFVFAQKFDQPLNSWDVSLVTDMFQLFDGTSFNQPLDSWDVSSLRTTGWMFKETKAFNQPLDTWNTSSLRWADGMFRFAEAFDQSLGSWDVSEVSDFRLIFENVKLSIENYDDTLIGWSTQTLMSGVEFDANLAYYSESAIDARNQIIAKGWTINDAGLADSIAPTINSPLDIVIEAGSSGNVVVWEVSDYNTPDDYAAYLDSEFYEFGYWTNGTIEISVDNFELGEYNLTLVIFDDFDNKAEDMVLVTVVDTQAPQINTPNEVNMIEGENVFLEWVVTDPNPDFFEIRVDDSLVETNDWDGENILFSLSYLEVGTYQITATVYDTLGQSSVAGTTVHVIENTGSSQNPDDNSGSSDNPEIPVNLLPIIFGMFSAYVSVQLKHRRLKH